MVINTSNTGFRNINGTIMTINNTHDNDDGNANCDDNDNRDNNNEGNDNENHKNSKISIIPKLMNTDNGNQNHNNTIRILTVRFSLDFLTLTSYSFHYCWN